MKEGGSAALPHFPGASGVGINPVQVVSSGVQTADPAPKLRQTASSTNLRDPVKMEATRTRDTPTAAPFPQTEVKVHPDNSTGVQILVYQFLNAKSGTVVYQIPSEQLLGLMKTIQQQLQRLGSKD